ncbi:MAG: hypothetical protein ACE5F9_05470 [Phycisphaerae bacterium]
MRPEPEDARTPTRLPEAEAAYSTPVDGVPDLLSVVQGRSCTRPTSRLDGGKTMQALRSRPELLSTAFAHVGILRDRPATCL